MIGRIARGTLARMGNVERCDKTLALNEMIFYVRRDARLAYMPAVAWRTGTGMVVWNEFAA